MAKIEIEIKNCKECPYFKMQRHYTSDSFENVFDWYCTKKGGKKIAGYVEWSEDGNVEIPDWCPCAVKIK